MGSSTSAKNSPRKPWNKSLDTDDDWDDRIQTISKATERLDLSAASKSPYPQVDFPVVVDAILEDPITMTKFMLRGDARVDKYCSLLESAAVNLTDLKQLAWKGVPDKLRAPVWQLLLGYLPTNSSRRATTLERKRREYRVGIEKAFDSKTTKDQAVWHQIGLDIPRTNPHLKLYSNACAQKSLERVLYLWAVRHPASGYVQGINDLCTPLYQTFLGFYFEKPIEEVDPSTLSENIVTAIEADTFWCLTKILDTIQDNYIHQQPGIRRQVKDLENLTGRIDEQLKEHIIQEGVDFMQFSFRWMNCLLMREFKMDLIVRMWDTYISEFPTGFSEFHVYVCCAFLMKFSDELKELKFQEIIINLQDTTKTHNWQVKDLELILSEAYIWQSLYKDATAHLK